MITEVGKRIHEGLVYINGEPCTKTKARKWTRCIVSGRSIEAGDMIYRPLSNSPTRSARYLASEIERIEKSSDT